MTTQQSVSPGDAGFKLTRREVLPLVGGRSTWSQEHLLPIFATVCVGLALVVVFNPSATGKNEVTEAWQVYAVLGVYIAFMVNYYVNLMCDRPKHLWLMALVALFTLLLLGTPVWQVWYDFFYSVIPGTQLEKSSNPVVKAAGYFFGTGLCEESFKALPLFVLVFLGACFGWLSRHSKGRLSRLFAGIRRQVGLNGPLDGIVLGVASGTGFFINETLGQYVPGIMTSAKYAGSQAFAGLVLLLSRGIPELVEHSAWAGLFGYFIGLTVLQPRMAVLLLPLGWFSAAALHAGWDAPSEIVNSGVVLLGCWLFVGLLSYALLAGAIFQARAMSTTSAKPQGAAPSGAPVPAMASAAPAVEAEWDSD